MLQLAIQWLYLDSNIIFECRSYFTFKTFYSTLRKIDEHFTTILCQRFEIVK